jgi:hypothetical protein
MGQANARGTREERVATAQAANQVRLAAAEALVKAERTRREAEVAAMHPAQQAVLRQQEHLMTISRARYNMMLAAVAGFATANILPIKEQT